MTVQLAAPSAVAPMAAEARGVGRAIAWRSFRQVWIGATVCAVVFGATVASSAVTYVTTFPDEASRQTIAASTSADRGLAVLLGPIGNIATVGGYTVYKCFVFLTTIGAIWALLAATRLLRGEEDAGRWQVVLAGATRPARATVATLSALGAAIGIVFVGTVLCTMLAGRDPQVGFSASGSLIYGASIVIAPLVFAAVGAVTSQLGRTRRLATGLGMAVFGVAFALRMVGDASTSTVWVRWLTPFGWSEIVDPFTTNDLRPVLLASVVTAALLVIAVVLSGRRDVGDGVIASHDVATVRPFGLRSPLGLAFRLDRGVLLAWILGAAATGLMLGVIAELTLASVPESMSNVLDKFGVEGAFVDQYLGVAFLLIATLVALLPAGQLSAAAAEVTSKRIVPILVQPTTRARWLVGRLVLCVAGVVLAAVVAGFCTWVGAASQGVAVDAAEMVAAGLNLVPVALVALGLGAVVLAFAPRFASTAVYAVIAWSLIIDLIASMVTGASWLGNLSLFHYLRLVPAQAWSFADSAVLTGIGLGLCALAVALFSRRDLAS